MRRKGFGPEFPAKVVTTQRSERMRIDTIGSAVLLGHQQSAGVPDRRRVRDRTIRARSLGPGRIPIGILCEQRATGGNFALVSLGLDVSNGESRLASLDAQRGNHPVA